MSSLTQPQEREVGGLLLSVVRSGSATAMLRAAHVKNALARVGVGLPLWMIHDLTLLFVDRDAMIAKRPGIEAALGRPDAVAQHGEWLAFVQELAASEVVDRARAWRLSDDLISVVFLRVLGPTHDRFVGGGRRQTPLPLPLDPAAYEDLDPRLPTLFTKHARNVDLALLVHLVNERLRMTIAFEQVDLDTLRLLGMFGAEVHAANATSALDLLHVLSSPEANDVVNFSLDLLPSVLETKRATGAQLFSIDGYSGLTRRGSLDSLVLSELAYDEDLFDSRFVENEVFFYAREKMRQDEQHLHYIVVDATASMRGQRSVFARGLALTLIKKLSLRGEDVVFRFFDSRLHEPRWVRGGRREKGIDVPYILSFKGEHGRHYDKVMKLLGEELRRLARRDGRRPTLYMITHGECHVPRETMSALARSASLYGIFMMPQGGKLDLEYADLLGRVQIVTSETLEKRGERSERAKTIVNDAAGSAARASLPPPPPTDPSAERARDLRDAEASVEALLGAPPGAPR